MDSSDGRDVDPLIKREPIVVVEVLSRSTEAFDRGDKFAALRTLASLREYWLVNPRSRTCSLYRLGDDGLWVLHPSGPADDATLASLSVSVPAAELWAELDAIDAAEAASAQDADDAGG